MTSDLSSLGTSGRDELVVEVEHLRLADRLDLSHLHLVPVEVVLLRDDFAPGKGNTNKIVFTFLALIDCLQN